MVAKKTRRKNGGQRLAVHILRITGSVNVLSGQNTGTDLFALARMILNDFSLGGMGFFSPLFMDFGTILGISLESPLLLKVKASVIWCAEFQTSRKIISSNGNFFYRVGVQFQPENEEEKKQIQLFFDELMRAHVLMKSD
jgi:c-di-GMP-binding flagellar brake protein YcgR